MTNSHRPPKVISEGLDAPPQVLITRAPSAPLSKGKAAAWVIATMVTPLMVSMLAANFYIAAWYVKRSVAGAPHEGPPPAALIQRAVISTAVVGLWFTVLLWWLLQRRAARFADLFHARPGRRLASDLAWGLAVGALWAVLYGLIGWPSFAAMFRLDGAKLASIPISLSAGFCEEVLFRGFVMLVIARAGGGTTAQATWSSLAFGAAHVFWGPVGMLFTAGLGISLALLTLWRGSVWSAVVAHSVLNLCIEPGLYEKAAASFG